MKYELYFDKENRVIKYAAGVTLAMEEIKELIRNISELAQQYNCYLFFCDIRKSTAKLAITDLIDMTKFYKQVPAIDNIKTAMIYRENSDNKTNLEFHEKLCITAGYHIKSFTCGEKAMKWLQSDHKSNSYKTFNLPV